MKVYKTIPANHIFREYFLSKNVRNGDHYYELYKSQDRLIIHSGVTEIVAYIDSDLEEEVCFEIRYKQLYKIGLMLTYGKMLFWLILFLFINKYISVGVLFAMALLFLLEMNLKKNIGIQQQVFEQQIDEFK